MHSLYVPPLPMFCSRNRLQVSWNFEERGRRYGLEVAKRREEDPPLPAGPVSDTKGVGKKTSTIWEGCMEAEDPRAKLPLEQETERNVEDIEDLMMMGFEF